MNDLFRSQFRLPTELAEKLRVAAGENSRSMNAEVVARLEKSFGVAAPAMGEVAKDLVEEFAAKRKISFSEALDALVFIGSNDDAPALLYVKAQPGMTLKEVREVMAEAIKVAHEDSHIIYEQGKRQT